MRGIAKVAEQCLMAATAQNIKKMALLLARFYVLYTQYTERWLGLRTQLLVLAQVPRIIKQRLHFNL